MTGNDGTMPPDAAMIRAFDNHNEPLVASGNAVLQRTYFNLLSLRRGGAHEYAVPSFETVCVVLSGECDFRVHGGGAGRPAEFAAVGGRPDVWSGAADAVYAPAGAVVGMTARADGTEVAVAGGFTAGGGDAPFRIRPAEAEVVEVGSLETHSRRRICHILGRNAAGRAGNLLVSELYADSGCWSGYPPHKHDENAGDAETAFEELYHYRFRPATGFGAQLCFQADGSSRCFMTRNRDTFLLARGYQPTVTSPGHEEYIFTILVGKTTRSLVQNFKEEHRGLMSTIPGIKAMRDAFR